MSRGLLKGRIGRIRMVWKARRWERMRYERRMKRIGRRLIIGRVEREVGRELMRMVLGRGRRRRRRRKRLRRRERLRSLRRVERGHNDLRKFLDLGAEGVERGFGRGGLDPTFHVARTVVLTRYGDRLWTRYI